jgi:hypothetical protein
VQTKTLDKKLIHEAVLEKLIKRLKTTSPTTDVARHNIKESTGKSNAVDMLSGAVCGESCTYGSKREVPVSREKDKMFYTSPCHNL